MNQLSETHPAENEEFMSGNHAISRWTQPFPQVWTDMALDQSLNLDNKISGGTICTTQRPGVLKQWFLTYHERAAITTAKDDDGISPQVDIATGIRIQPDGAKILRDGHCSDDNMYRT